MPDTLTVPQSRCQFAIEVGDMTPPVGMYHRMWGAARHDRSTGIHRPLRATVAVFRPLDAADGTGPDQILVSLDCCILGEEELGRIEQGVMDATGVERSQVAVVCTHTHGAGLLSLDRVSQPGGDLIPEYLAKLARTVGELARRAQSRVQPATILYATGRCDLAQDRDYWDEQRQQFVCGLNPHQAADDTLLVARVDDENGRVLATVVNYACHPTTLAWDNTLVSPDFPGALRELVEETIPTPCLFLQGACGELGPREGFVGDVAVADRNGRQLGYAALAALTALPAAATCYTYSGPVVSGATIGTWSHQALTAEQRAPHAAWHAWGGGIDLPYRTDMPPLETVATELHANEEAEATFRRAGDDAAAAKSRALAERGRRELARRRSLPAGETYPWRVAVWRIGDAVWLCVQGESYSLLQTALRERFPDRTLIVASIAFSWAATYLPPADTYGKGLYQESIAILAPGSLEQAIELLAARIEQCFGAATPA